MTELNALLASLDSTVGEVLGYFEGPGATTEARVGDWGAWEVLAHFLYWHEATAKGMEMAARGYGPYVVTGETDAVNAEVVAAHTGETITGMVAQAHQLQSRLDAAARQLNDLDAVVMERLSGPMTARQRLERIINHWKAHTEELKQ